MWNDDRVDERFRAIDQRFDAVDRRFDAVDARLDRLEARMDAGFAEVRADNTSLRTTLIQAAFGVIGILLAEVVALLIALA